MTDLRLPLDLLLTKDVDELEDAIHCEYAVENDGDIAFCRNKDELEELVEDIDNPKYYEIDEIETDRIQAIIDLLNLAEDNSLLCHILNRIVR